MMRLEAVGETHVGSKRNHNEDAFAIVDEVPLCIVADGMGGHAAGEVASRLAVFSVREYFRKAPWTDAETNWPVRLDAMRGLEEERLVSAIKFANHRIYDSAQRESQQKGMGTTIACILGVRDGVHIAHVGDSRVYRIREGHIELLTEDHSLLNDYVRVKNLTVDEAHSFPHKNVIVRALGMKHAVKVDARFEAARDNDTFLLCSDGLSGPVPEREMLDVILGAPDLHAAVLRLINHANDHGGPDNITAVLARVRI